MFNFYLITFYLKYFPGSIFKNSIWFALSDFLSYFFSGNVLKYTNTNRTLLISYAVSAAGALSYLLFYWNVSLVPLFIILSRLGNGMAYNTQYASNNRLFPTQFLASTFGIVNLVSHLYAIAAPMIAEMGDPYPFLAFFANAVMGIVCSFLLVELNNNKDNGVKGDSPLMGH